MIILAKSAASVKGFSFSFFRHAASAVLCRSVCIPRPQSVVFNRHRDSGSIQSGSVPHEKSAMMLELRALAALQQLQLVDHFVRYNRESLHAGFDRIRINRHAMPTLRALPLQSGKIFRIIAELAGIVKTGFRQLPAEMISVQICPNVGNPFAEVLFASCHALNYTPIAPLCNTVRRPGTDSTYGMLQHFSDERSLQTRRPAGTLAAP